MLAVILSLAIFVWLSVVGYAVLCLLAREEEPLYRLLLAPVTGAAIAILLTFAGNEAGMPIRYFAIIVVALVFAVAMIMLWRWGQPIRFNDIWPYALLICLGLLMTGWPMLHFGFDWVSFCNDDMANYCMGTERVLRHGYFQPPGAAAVAGLDYTQLLWFLHIFHRPGSEMVLALVSATTGIGSLRIFMPTIMAFMLCQISAAGALTFGASRSRLATWVVMGLMSVAALVALGTLYQLIAQVIGLALAAAITSVLLRPIEGLPPRRRFARGGLIGLLLAGLIVSYTEAVPFVALGYFLYAALAIRGSWAAWRRVLIMLGIVAVAVFILLNRYVPLALLYMLGQAYSVVPENPTKTMFPYYMKPAGPVFFWGLFPIGHDFPSDLAFSVMIVLAIALSFGSALLVFRTIRRRQAPGFVCAVMVLLFIFLFRHRSGFGMYKLAMYLQPFFLPAVVLGWFSLWRNRLIQVFPLVLLGLGNVRSHLFYTRSSLGGGSVFNEIASASSTHLVREFADLIHRDPSRPLEVDTFNVVLAKFQMTESIGRPLTFPSNRFMQSLGLSQAYEPVIGTENVEKGEAVSQAYRKQFAWGAFEMRPPDDSSSLDWLLLSNMGRKAVLAAETPAHPLLFVGVTGRQAPFNRWQDPEETDRSFRAGGLDEFQNHLIFTTSVWGRPYYVSFREHVAIYQLEPDVAFENRTMAGVGRYLVFGIVHPSAGCRLKLEITDTFTGDGENRLPPADAVGDTRNHFPIVGRGSARVFSEPLRPQIIDGEPFVAVDLGADGRSMNHARGGLAEMWGSSVRLDPREIVGFLRDISMVSDAEYQSLNAPAAIRSFPADLANRVLEYSGLYEDGYMGDRAFAMLSPLPGSTLLVARGVVPQVNDPGFVTEAILSVDGREYLRRKLPVGNFELSAMVPQAPGRRKVELSFSRLQNLPGNDRRPIGGQLRYLGFVPPPSSVTWSVNDPARRAVQYSGIWEDGWMEARASIHLAQPPDAARLVVRGMIPKINKFDYSSEVALNVDGKEVARKSFGVGDFQIAADLPPGPADHKIEVSFSNIQQLPPPDKRAVGALLKSIAFVRADATN